MSPPSPWVKQSLFAWDTLIIVIVTIKTVAGYRQNIEEKL